MTTEIDAEGLVFEFDRYINGVLMAEGVTIERATTLEKAMLKAAKIASRGPNGEVPVLVLRAATRISEAAEPVAGWIITFADGSAGFEFLEEEADDVIAAAKPGATKRAVFYTHPSPTSDDQVEAVLAGLERYEQFVDGWGDEVLGLKNHPHGDYVKFEDVCAALASLRSPKP